jgi:hypothetical protein
VGVLMDLVAGDAREILLAIAVGDWAGLRDPNRFVAYVSLGGGMDQTWLDLFAQAARMHLRQRAAALRRCYLPAGGAAGRFVGANCRAGRSTLGR